MMQPLAIDLCCGKGGWASGLLASGFRVVGFDLTHYREFPGELVVQDVRTLSGDQVRSAQLIVASPPCQEFSRHDMPWTRARNPPLPDLSIAEACWRIRQESGVPTIIENVRGSRRWLEPLFGFARRCGSFWLYGDVPVLLPKMYAASGVRQLRPGEYNSKERAPHNSADRAIIPFELARWIGEVYR
jgi:DNA (cytosine-5)-methyltransferase 1